QFDYIRFPSDGNMSLVEYAHYDPIKETRSDVMIKFFAYLDQELRQKGIPISADLFGFAYWSRDFDMNIGQRIRDAAPYFTALSPMAYPSHYPAGTLDFKNPADHPYEIVAETLKKGKEIMAEFPEVKWQSRPWIQDFDIGADYDAAKIQAQMKAVVDEGGSGWLLWNARNVYTEDALGPQVDGVEAAGLINNNEVQ
ncbi:MAG: putative glycoside hydrolase, partial [bacterium]